jgi:NifB/MoaA-like Fe-S oxidoreductase
MLGNRFAGEIFPKVRRLADAGITMNGQIVLCRGINDGPELERSIRDLSSYRPAMRSVSVVPVGLTKFREGLTRLHPFDRESACEVIDTIEKWQNIFANDGISPDFPHFIHASDEWYIPCQPENDFAYTLAVPKVHYGLERL